jgi:hypothetical protein
MAGPGGGLHACATGSNDDEAGVSMATTSLGARRALSIRSPSIVDIGGFRLRPTDPFPNAASGRSISWHAPGAPGTAAPRRPPCGVRISPFGTMPGPLGMPGWWFGEGPRPLEGVAAFGDDVGPG